MYRLLVSPWLVFGFIMMLNPSVAQAPSLPITVPMRTVSYAEVQMMSVPQEDMYMEEEISEEYIMETEVTDEEFELLSDLVMAEAENQSWDAQYGVACVVLNRVKSDLFPDTVSEVIYQREPNVQFSCTADGRLDEIIAGESSDSVKEAVESALQSNDYPEDVLYFTSCGYLGNTDPYEKVDDMYFSR